MMPLSLKASLRAGTVIINLSRPESIVSIDRIGFVLRPKKHSAPEVGFSPAQLLAPQDWFPAIGSSDH